MVGDQTLGNRSGRLVEGGTRRKSLALTLRPAVQPSRSNGGLTYTKPANTDAVSYYKIYPSNAITWGWNFTSL